MSKQNVIVGLSRQALRTARLLAARCGISISSFQTGSRLAEINGMSDSDSREEEFFELAERFRASNDPDEAKKLGDQLGRLVFGE